MKILVLTLCGVFYSAVVAAETLDVEYSSFYSHIKKLDDPDTQALRFAFGFWHINQQRLCHISRAKIVTQKQQLPLVVEHNGRFTVPLDKILKMARAKVSIELTDQANQCDMSVQLETLPRFLKTAYTNKELKMIFQQYQAFFSGIGGFMSFMMPSVQGLVMQFENVNEFNTDLQPLVNEQGYLQLTQAWIEQGNSLNLPNLPLRITALVEK